MNFGQNRRIGRELPRFLKVFRGCFGRSDTQKYLGIYAFVYHRRHDKAAKFSHIRTTIKELSRCGIDFHRIRSYWGAALRCTANFSWRTLARNFADASTPIKVIGSATPRDHELSIRGSYERRSRRSIRPNADNRLVRVNRRYQ